MAFFLNKVRKYLPLIVGTCLLGFVCSAWFDMWANEKAETIVAASLFVSFMTLISTMYFTVEIALESRSYNKKKLFSDYCTRFSTSPYIMRVTEWLFAISELDSDSGVLKVYPKRSKDDKGNTITEPTPFEKDCYWNFLKELNIQIKSGQIDKDDARKVFSFYAQLYDKTLQIDNKTAYNELNKADITELLSDNENNP